MDVRARAFSLLVLVGTGLSAVSLGANLTPDRHRVLLLVTCIAAMPIAALVYPLRRAIPSWTYPSLLVPGAATQLGAAIVTSGDSTNPAAAFYIPCALYAFYFFERRVAWAQLAYFAVSYAAALATIAGPGEALDRWLFVMGMAAPVGLVIAHLRDRLIDQARADWLTGVANRRGFEELLALELRLASGAPRPVGLVVVDADDFKRLNDTKGHAAGDHALVQIARALESVAGRGRVARLGGDEFAAVLPDHDLARATDAASRIRERLLAEVDGPRISAGVAAAEAGAPADGQALVRAADMALYEAKRAGRGRVMVAA